MRGQAHSDAELRLSLVPRRRETNAWMVMCHVGVTVWRDVSSIVGLSVYVEGRGGMVKWYGAVDVTLECL